MKKRLAIITTHPIQYNAPLFALLSSRNEIIIKVFYTWGENVLNDKYDPGFEKKIAWDIPLLEGYEYEFVSNRSTKPGSDHFNGIDNPDLIDDVIRWKAEAILVFGWAFKSHLKLMRYFHGRIPVIFRGDSTWLRTHSSVKNTLRELFLKWVYKHVDFAVYVGNQNEIYFKKCGLKSSQLVFGPHAIDNDRFLGFPEDYITRALDWKRKLGISPEELVIMYAGKLEKIKNPGFIVKLAKEFIGLPVRFLIVGNGPMEKVLREEAADNQQVTFIDFQNQLTMPVVYRLCDLFILPSVSETWGLSVNEAMACGRGVLVRDTCGCATDLVIDDYNGFIFKVKEFDRLTKNIKELILDRRKVSSFGENSLQKIKSFSYENVAQAVEQLLAQL